MAGAGFEAGDRFGLLFGEEMELDGVVLGGRLVVDEEHFAIDVEVGEAAEAIGAPEGVGEQADDGGFDDAARAELVHGRDVDGSVLLLCFVGEGGDVGGPDAVFEAGLAAALEAFGGLGACGLGPVDARLLGFADFILWHYLLLKMRKATCAFIAPVACLRFYYSKLATD